MASNVDKGKTRWAPKPKQVDIAHCPNCRAAYQAAKLRRLDGISLACKLCGVRLGLELAADGRARLGIQSAIGC